MYYLRVAFFMLMYCFLKGENNEKAFEQRQPYCLLFLCSIKETFKRKAFKRSFKLLLIGQINYSFSLPTMFGIFLVENNCQHRPGDLAFMPQGRFAFDLKNVF